MILRDARYLMSGTPDQKSIDILNELFALQTRVAIWSHRDGRAFVLTSMTWTFLPGRDEPSCDLIFQQVGPLDSTERLFDDRAAWITSVRPVAS